MIVSGRTRASDASDLGNSGSTYCNIIIIIIDITCGINTRCEMEIFGYEADKVFC